VLLFTSLNEVTPMVIAESLMRSIPVITTNIAGIPEMFEHGKHGYALPPGDVDGFTCAMAELSEAGPDGQRRRLQMAAAGKKHADSVFTNAHMVERYRAAILELAPPIVLLDMDGKRFCNELGRRDYVTGMMWKNKGFTQGSTTGFFLCLNGKASTEITWHCKHYKGRGIMKSYKNMSEFAAEYKEIGTVIVAIIASAKWSSAILEPCACEALLAVHHEDDAVHSCKVVLPDATSGLVATEVEGLEADVPNDQLLVVGVERRRVRGHALVLQHVE